MRTRRNPAFLSDKRVWFAGAVGVSAIGWVYWRTSERRRLVAMLDASPAVAARRTAGLIDWSSDEKAAEAIGFVDATSAELALAKIIDELPPLPISQQSWLPESLPAPLEQAADVASDAFTKAKEWAMSWF